MENKDFHMGLEFYCGGKHWRATDIGSRVVIAICLEHDDDPSWYHGPPYTVDESVFDECDMPACSLTSEEDMSEDSRESLAG